MLKKKEIVNRYLKTLGFSTITDIHDIEKLMKAHIQTFCFSTMPVLLKDEISLKLESIYKKIVVHKRGGYCFEHNKLFFKVLKTLGFDVEFYLARVVNNQNIESAKTHRFTLLNYQNKKYLIDVGFGFTSPSIPVKFGYEEKKSYFDIKYRIRKYPDNTFGFEYLRNNSFFTMYKFDLKKCYEVDFEISHFYSHRHPKAVFVNNLVFSRITKNVVYSLKNSTYEKIYKNKKEVLQIKNIEHFTKILQHDMNSNFNPSEIKFIYEKYVKNKV